MIGLIACLLRLCHIVASVSVSPVTRCMASRVSRRLFSVVFLGSCVFLSRMPGPRVLLGTEVLIVSAY